MTHKSHGVPTVFPESGPPSICVPVPSVGGNAVEDRRQPSESGTPSSVRERRQGTPSLQFVKQAAINASEHGAVNVRGNSRDPARGAYRTPKWLADLLGPYDLDPFSNPLSHIHATESCTLELGGDGFGDNTPGSYRTRNGARLKHATDATKLWFQPDYQFVLRGFNHYRHTRWTALLRFDPRPEWFDAVYDASELVAVLRHDPDGKPFGFEPPPGITASSNTFPHALFFKHATDAPSEVLRFCIAWRKGSR